MAVRSEWTGPAGDGVTNSPVGNRLPREHGLDTGVDDTVISRRQAEPCHRAVQTSRVSGQRERHSVDHFARLEDAVAYGHAMVERGDRRSRGAHPLAVHPHPGFIGRLADIAQLAHRCTLLTVSPSQMPARSGEPP